MIIKSEGNKTKLIVANNVDLCTTERVMSISIKHLPGQLPRLIVEFEIDECTNKIGVDNV